MKIKEYLHKYYNKYFDKLIVNNHEITKVTDFSKDVSKNTCFVNLKDSTNDLYINEAIKLGAKTIIAIDIKDSRLEIAKSQNLATHYLNPYKCDIEKEIKKLTGNRGADKVIEAAGSKETFEMAWKIARANAIIGVVALYEENQILPLPQMYGKNLTFKTGGIDAIYSDELIKLISEKKINTDFMFTHTYKLENIMEAYKVFQENNEECIKIAII